MPFRLLERATQCSTSYDHAALPYPKGCLNGYVSLLPARNPHEGRAFSTKTQSRELTRRYLVKQPTLRSAGCERLPDTSEALLKIEGPTSLPISLVTSLASRGARLFSCPDRRSAGSSMCPARGSMDASQDVHWVALPAVVAAAGVVELRRGCIGRACYNVYEQPRDVSMLSIKHCFRLLMFHK